MSRSLKQNLNEWLTTVLMEYRGEIFGVLVLTWFIVLIAVIAFIGVAMK